MSDIVYATGAIHDEAGPISSFVGITQDGRDWIDAYGIGGSYTIETHMFDYTVECIENDGLTVSKA